MRFWLYSGGVAWAVLALGACSSSSGAEACGPALFEMTPAGGEMYTIENRTVCFHSQQEIDGCPIWNYRIPPSEDFSEYIDIFYGGECTTNDFDGAFNVDPEAQGGPQYQLSGTPAPPPPSRPRQDLMGSGTYVRQGDVPEQGTFELFW
jgi:hypothetical protein